jgi:hypothetical protein
VALLAGTGPAARAAKWESCPAPPFPVYPSVLGATNSPFVHPGHDLTIVLNEDEAAASGGFSTEPGGNEVHVRFLSPLGTPVQSEVILADASETSLTFAFPIVARDGESLVGPVEVLVLVAGQTVAHIGAEDLVAIPPTNEISAIMFGTEEERIVFGAIGADGDLWVPVRFNAEPMEKVTCPGDFIVPVSFEVGAALIDGEWGTQREPLRQIRGVSGYLGDVQVRDYSLYGSLFQNDIRLVHVGNTLGVTICQLNDALDIVLRVRGERSWVRSRRSPFDPFVRQCRPVPLLLEPARRHPERSKAGSAPSHVDSFANECSPQPVPPRR